MRPTSIPSGILVHPAVWPQKMGRKLGALSPFWGRGAGSPSSTIWPGPKPTSMPSAVLIHPAVWSQKTWAENWLPLFGEGELGPLLTQCRPGLPRAYRGRPSRPTYAYLRTKWHLDPCSRVHTCAENWLRPLFREGQCPHRTQSPLG